MSSRSFANPSIGGLAACAGLCLSASAIAVPPVVDRCPEDAMVVVAVNNFDALQKDVGDMAKLIGMPLPMDMKQAMLAAGIEKGVRSDGSAAIVLFAPAPDAEKNAKPEDDMGGDDEEDADENDPPAIAIVPVTEYAAFLENFGATAGPAGGIDTVDMKGRSAFARNIGGGYAALSPDRALLERFTGKDGAKAAFEKLAGPAGNALSDSADLSVIVNVARARPMIDAAMKRRLEEVADQMAMMGGDDPDFSAGEWLAKSMLDDARGTVIGLSIDNLGAGIDMVTAFNEGSRWAKVSSFAGKSGQLMSKLPGGPYLFACAMDLSSPEVKSVIKEYISKAPKSNEQAGAMPTWMSSLDSNDGGSMVIGMSPAGVMGGMFAATVTYTATTDPGSAVKATRSAFSDLESSKKATIKWSEGEKEIAGVRVDAFEAKMAPDPENPFAAQAGAMMFGPAGGPSGYIAKVDGGVIMTLAKNSKLMEKAIGASKGDNALNGERVIQQVGAKLPEGRAFEAYVGVKGILDTFLPLAAMFGAPLPAVDVPDNLPPAAVAITPQTGSVRLSIYLPAPTVKTVADLVREVRGMAGEPPADAPDNKDDTGQPGF
ncbi:MAG: hypothetical protein AB7V47_04225 [Phycisphaerales bacterium]